MKEYLYARQQWYTPQLENKGYTRKDKEMTKPQIDSLKVALHVLREKRREIEKMGNLIGRICHDENVNFEIWPWSFWNEILLNSEVSLSIIQLGTMSVGTVFKRSFWYKFQRNFNNRNGL
ncbi:MAG: hypothetical protein IPN26_10445 [Bacteroidetes bacterium]|nr:hypothetical protein [Bacteroidota bacterium]